MRITFEEGGFNDYVYWQKTDRKIVDKINSLLRSIARNGAMQGEDKPEKLKHRQGVYSRRIDLINRLIYKYSEDTIVVVSCKGHYN